MSFAILGVGTALPESSLSQAHAAALTSYFSGHTDAEARRLSVLYRRTGIQRRHVAIVDCEPFREVARSGEDPFEINGAVERESNGFGSANHSRGESRAGAVANPPTEELSTAWRMKRYAEAVRPLALAAARDAIRRGGVDPSAIQHLVTVSCTGFAAPGFDVALIKELGLPPTVERTNVGFMGCHGALNGLRVAHALAKSDPSSRVLVCAAELCSLHFQQGPGSDRAVANALFADGAAAVVGANTSEAALDEWTLAASGSFLTPDTEDAMTWTIGDHGFAMTLSPRVASQIATHLRPWLIGWLGQSGIRLQDVGSWAIHPGGPRILDAVADTLDLTDPEMADSRAVFADHGNMSSPTVLFILDRLRRRKAPRPCVALGFGPGLVIEAALFV